MDRIKVLSKANVIELLEEGNILRYERITAKAYIADTDWEIIGAVVWKTYLKLKHELDLVEIPTYTTLRVLYKLKGK